VKVTIEFNDIKRRIVEAPVREGIYSHLGVTDSKLLYIFQDVRGSLDRNIYDGSAKARGVLKVWDFDFQKEIIKFPQERILYVIELEVN